jgi:hypothetical protein
VPKGKLSIQSNGSAPASFWITSGVPIFAGFGENTAGNADNILAMASNTANARAVFLGRKSRGTLAVPTAVQNNDYLMSIFASGYDGAGNFQSPATLDFFVDGTVSSGKVPTRASISTGSSFSDRTERLKVGSTGNIDINNGQLYVRQSNGHVGIGTSSPAYKLDVEASANDTAVYGHGSTGVFGSGTGSFGYGVEGISDDQNGRGVEASSPNIGVFGYAPKYGVFGATLTGGYAGYFNGNVYTVGSYLPSDSKLKDHVARMDSALDIISRLQPKVYEYKQDGSFKAMLLPTGRHYGLIAQELEQVLPGLVRATTFDTKMAVPGRASKSSASQTDAPSEVIDFKAVNYTELIPIIVKAMQEQLHQQDSINKALLTLVTELQNKVAELSGQSIGQTDETGSLGQNVPNPAGQLTSVSYRVPPTSRQAYLAVIDNGGRLLQNIRVTGSGVARINTAGLTGGVYHYSLIVDNRVVDTKQLLIAR